MQLYCAAKKRIKELKKEMKKDKKSKKKKDKSSSSEEVVVRAPPRLEVILRPLYFLVVTASAHDPRISTSKF